MRWLPLLLLAGCLDVVELMSTTEYGIAGLFTDAATIAPRPQGALSDATNICIRRPGIAEPRPPLGDTGDGTNIAGDVIGMIDFDGDVLLAVSSPTLLWLSATGTAANQDNEGVSWSRPLVGLIGYRDGSAHAKMRGNLYVPSGYAMLKYTSGGETTPEQCQAPVIPHLVQQSAATSGVLAAERSWSYRFTWERKDVNNVITVSAPSGAYVFANTHASNTYKPTLYIATSEYTAGDVLRIYRTRPVDNGGSPVVQPGDEHREIHAYTLLAADVSAGYYQWADTKDDAAAGVYGLPLYTNPGQGGFDANANLPAPSGFCMAEYQGSLWVGSYQPHGYKVVRGLIGGQPPSQPEDIGKRPFTGDVGSGSEFISNISSTATLKIGMIVERTDGTHPFSGQVTIVDITDGNTVEVSSTATATVVGAAFTFHDAIWIGSDAHRVGSVAELAWSLRAVAGDTTPGPSEYQVLCPGVAGIYDVVNSLWRPVHSEFIIFQQYTNVPSATALFSSSGVSFEPPLSDLPSDTTYGDSRIQRQPVLNGLAFSKTDQPEHFPVGNFILVGNGDARVLAIKSTNAALWVFKEDGLFRLTGAGAETGWSVDKISGQHVLIAGGYATVLNDYVYAWTVAGIVRIGSDGIVNLSRGRIQSSLDANQAALGAASSQTGHAWSDQSANEVYFPDITANAIWVWNALTETWAKWTVEDSTIVYSGVWDPSGDVLYLGTKSGVGDGVKAEGTAQASASTSTVGWRQAQDAPGVMSRFDNVALLYEDSGDMGSVSVTFGNEKASASPLTFALSDSAGSAGGHRMFVPRAVALGSGLTTTVALEACAASATAPKTWRITGLRVNSRPTNTAVTR